MKMVDIIIIGAGPSGMMAAIYAKKASKEVMILDKNTPGGRLRTTYQIDNYLGFGRVNAKELVQKMINHIKDSDIQVTNGLVDKIEKQGNQFLVHAKDDVYLSKAVIIATGTNPMPLGIENEELFSAKGVSYCAVCDGLFFEGEDVVMIGGGDSALEESLYLVEIAKSVTIVHEMDHFTASESIIQKALAHDRIKTRLNTSAMKFQGDDYLKSVLVKNTKNGEEESIACSGAFIYVGNKADTSFLSSFIKIDHTGYIKVNQEMQTQIPGVFACGDVTKKDYRFIVTAISDGAIAALSTVKYIDQLTKTG